MALLFGLTNSVASYIQLILMFTYLVIAISSILFCVKRLSSTGLSDEIKALIYRRHIYWIVSFIVANTYLIFLNLVVILQSANRNFHIQLVSDNRALKFFAFFTNGQGFFIVFHVLVEPQFYKIIFNELSGRSEKNKELPSLIMFASQLNAEMVYCILKGITQFSKVTFDRLAVSNNEFYRLTTREILPTYSEDGLDAIIRFDKIKIKQKNWAEIK